MTKHIKKKAFILWFFLVLALSPFVKAIKIYEYVQCENDTDWWYYFGKYGTFEFQNTTKHNGNASLHCDFGSGYSQYTYGQYNCTNATLTHHFSLYFWVYVDNAVSSGTDLCFIGITLNDFYDWFIGLTIDGFADYYQCGIIFTDAFQSYQIGQYNTTTNFDYDTWYSFSIVHNSTYNPKPILSYSTSGNESTYIPIKTFNYNVTNYDPYSFTVTGFDYRDIEFYVDDLIISDTINSMYPPIVFEISYPFIFILGMVGLGSMIGGLLWFAKSMKEHDIIEAITVGFIFAMIGTALFISWLWSF